MNSNIRNTYCSTVFNADFNNFAPLTMNQAWSLFFTLGKDDAALGDNPEAGRFLTNSLMAIAVTFFIGAYILRHF